MDKNFLTSFWKNFKGTMTLYGLLFIIAAIVGIYALCAIVFCTVVAIVLLMAFLFYVLGVAIDG